MKTLRKIFAGMTVMAAALSFASCGAAQDADKLSAQLAAVSPAAQNAAADEISSEYPEIRALINAARADDFEAYLTACGTKETYHEFMVRIGAYSPAYSEDGAANVNECEYSDEQMEEEWRSNIKCDFDYNVPGAKALNADYTVTVGELSEDELAEWGFGEDEAFPEDVDISAKKVSASDTDGNKAEFVYEVIDVKNAGTLNSLFLSYSNDESAKDSAVQITMDSNAKTLYNAAAEALYNMESSGNKLGDGVYEYCTDKKYDDELGKNIAMIFSVVPEYKALCTVKVTDGIVEYVTFDPQDGSGVIGTYPTKEG